MRVATTRRGRLITIILGTMLAAGACSGAPAPSSDPATPLASGAPGAPGASAANLPTNAATQASPPPTASSAIESTGPIDPPTDVCAPFAAGAKPPATAEETALLDSMPKTVDGEPVTRPEVYRGIRDICSSESYPDDAVEAVLETFGLDMRTVVIGSFGVTVEGYMFSVWVYRAPGQDANTMLTALAAIGRVDPADFKQGSVGGKDILYLEDGYGGKNYRYVDGDTVWEFNFLTDAQAAKLIAALE